MDSIRKVEGLYVLDEVEIKSKRRQGSNMATKINEKSIDAYYDVRRSVDLLRDNGKIVTTIPELMEKLSPQFDWDRSNDKLTYRQKPICYIMDNHILSETETQMMLTEVDWLLSSSAKEQEASMTRLSKTPKCPKLRIVREWISANWINTVFST